MNTPVQLTARDLRVCSLLRGLKLLTAPQIAVLAFRGLKSHTPRDRSLMRLRKAGLIRPVGRRGWNRSDNLAGGLPIIYALTPAGYRAIGENDIPATPRGIHTIEHTLCIADAVCYLYAQEQAGALRVVEFVTEPDNHTRIGGAYLRPDLTLAVDVPGINRRARVWLEVDLDEQSDTVIKRKLAAYMTAYQASSDSEPWHKVIFAVPHEARAQKLREVIKREARDYAPLFDVMLLSRFVDYFNLPVDNSH